MLVEDENLILSVDESWSNDYSITIRGWLISKKRTLDKVEIFVGGNGVPITAWHPRPDVTAVYPQFQTQNCGFVVHLPRIAKHQVTFNAYSQGETYNKILVFDGSLPQSINDYIDSSNLNRLSLMYSADGFIRRIYAKTRFLNPKSSLSL